MTLNKNQLKNNNKKLLLKKNLKNKHSLWKNILLIKLKLPLTKKITSTMKSTNKPLLNYKKKDVNLSKKKQILMIDKELNKSKKKSMKNTT